MDNLCLETRRQLTIDPDSRDSEVMQHLGACEVCTEFLQGIKQFDSKLKTAVNIDVPEGLESRIILAQRMSDNNSDSANVIPLKKKKTTSEYRWMSLAAALVLAVGLSLGMFKFGQSVGVQNEVLAHIDSHLFELEEDHNVELASLNNLLQEHGLLANENIGYIRHVSNCPIEDKMVPHLVLGDDKGKPITVMYIPWKNATKRSSFKNERFNGVLVGADKGSFVIVSEDPNSLATMEDRVLKSMEVKI